MEKVLVFGVKNNPPDLYKVLEEKYDIIGVVDNNKLVQHTYVNEKYVYLPDELEKLVFDKIIIGAASHTATKAILEECLNRGIKRSDIISDYAIKTQPMSTVQLFIMQHKENKMCKFENFARMNLLIHYAFVEQYYGKNTIGFQMADKYMKLVCEEERATNHTKYFSELIKNMEKYGYYQNSNISVNRRGQLVDGTHRLSYLLQQGIMHANVDIFNGVLSLGEGGDRDLNWLIRRKETFEKREISYLESVYDKIIKELQVKENLVRKEADLWKKTES